MGLYKFRFTIIVMASSSVQPHRKRVVHRPAPAPHPVNVGSYNQPDNRYTVQDILQDPLLALAAAKYGPRPSPRYGSSIVRPFSGTERKLRDAARYNEQTGHPYRAALLNAAGEVVRVVNDNIGPVTAVVGGAAIAAAGTGFHIDTDPDQSEPEKQTEPEKVPVKVPVVKDFEKEPVKKTEPQEYKVPEKVDKIPTVAKGRSRAATEFFTGAGQVASYVSAVEGGNADGSFDPSDRAQVQQVGPIAQYLAGVASAFKDSDPQSGVFVQHWWGMQWQMKTNVTQDLSGVPGKNCGSSLDETSIRTLGAHKALDDIQAMKALAAKAGLDFGNVPVQKPNNYVGGFGWEVAQIINKNTAAINKALAQVCTVDKGEAALSPEDIQPGVDTLAKLGQVVAGLKDWADKEPTGLGPVSPWVAGVDNLGKVYTGPLARASAQALADGIGLANQYNDAELGIGEPSEAFAGLAPFNLPPTIEGLALDSAVPAYLGFEPILKGNMKDPDGKGIRTGQVQIGDDIAELPVSGKATETIHYTLKNLQLGNNKVLVRAGDSAWVVDTSLDVEVTDPLPTMDIWNSSVEKVSDGLYKVYVSAFLADDNNNVDSVRAVDVNGSGFNVNMEKTAETKLENGKTFVRYEGVQNVRLNKPGDSRDLTLQLRYKDPTNPEVQAPNTERVRVEYLKPEPIPNPGNNGTPQNNSTVPPVIITENGNTEQPRDYRGWLAGLVALAGGGAAVSQRARIAAALGMGNNGNVMYAPIAPEKLEIKAVYVMNGSIPVLALTTNLTRDPSVDASMLAAVTSFVRDSNGAGLRRMELEDGTWMRMRSVDGGLNLVVTSPDGAGIIEDRIEGVASYIGQIKSVFDNLQGATPPVFIENILKEILTKGTAEGKPWREFLSSADMPPLPQPAQVPSLSDAQAQAERPTLEGELPGPSAGGTVTPAPGFEPPRRPSVVSGPQPVPPGVSALLSSTPVPPAKLEEDPFRQSADALRRSIVEGTGQPGDAIGVGMHPQVPANGNGETVDMERILGRVRGGTNGGQ